MAKHLKKAAKAVVKADKTLTHAAAKHRNHPAAKVAGWVSELADQPPLIALSLATVAAGAVSRRPKLARNGARMLAAHLAATLARAAVKATVDRARPAHALETGDERFEAGDGAEDKALNSFPSGHTAGAVAIARAVGREFPDAASPALAASALVALAQPPSGKHYWLDTVAGAAIGWAAERAVSLAFDRWAPPAAIPPPDGRPA